MKPVLAISIGCPSGIGPEVAVHAAASARDALCLLVGDFDVLIRAARIVGVDADRLVAIQDPAAEIPRIAGQPDAIAVFSPGPRLALDHAPFGHPTAEAGRAQLLWIDEATELVRSGLAQGLVTGPVSKHAILSSGGGEAAARFLGHTEHLAQILGADEVTMAFASEELVVGLVTTHLPLRRVPSAITRAEVVRATAHLAELMTRLSRGRPRIAVASLNPHAGEEGALGGEEAEHIAPGIELARERLRTSGIDAEVVGPIGAESAIRLAYRRQRFDAVVAMYHDQATIPMKLIGFGEAVNVTLGLPIVRTSVDHGTAYDLAGTGQASADGMRSAIELALRLARTA